MLRRSLYVLVLLFIFLPSCFAQLTPRFSHITTKDGLGDNTIWTVYQDESGFIWLGTLDGLYRYDGSELQLIRRNFFKNSGRGSSVRCIQEDKKRKCLWLLVDNRIFSYNMLKETFSEKHIIPVEGTIYDLCINDDGDLWIAVFGQGIYHYSPSSNKTTRLERPKVDLNYVTRIKRCNSGIYGFLTVNQGIYLYNTTTHEMEYFFNGMAYSAFFVDQDYQVWGASSNGLYCWQPSTDQAIRISLRGSTEAEEPYITEITQNKEGDCLYLSTDRGLYLYDKKNGSLQILRAEYESSHSLNCNYLNSVYFDRENTLWIPTYFGGVNFMSENSQNFLLHASHNKEMDGHVISAFAEDSSGNLWIGTEDGGMSYFDKKTGEITNYNPKISKQSFLDFYNIHALLLDHDELYIGLARAGVCIYNTRTQKVKKLKSASNGGKLSAASIYSFEKISDHEIAIGGIHGMDIYNSRNGDIQNIPEIPKRMVNCILKDEFNGIWACGKTMGVYYKGKDRKWKKVTNENSEIKIPEEVYTISQKDKIIYLGTQDCGIITYNLITKQRDRILVDELKDVAVYTILPQDNWLWICTSNGIYYYDLSDRKVRYFTETDGLFSSQFNWNAGIIQQDGTVFIGGLNGYNAFRTDLLRLDSRNPKTILTDFTVNNQRWNPAQNPSQMKRSITYTDSMELAYHQNNISIRCATLNSMGHSSDRYRYRLFPVDREWKTAKNNVFNYNQLPPGEYIFTAYGSKNNVWDSEGVNLYIKILAPWWIRWYMVTLYVCIALLGGILLLKRWYNIQKAKLSTQKDEELYRSKLEFFTNVIHEIRTPLTLILSPLKMLEKRKDTGSIQFELDIMRRNGDRLLHLINQLMDYRKLDSNLILDEEGKISRIDVCEETERISLDFRLEAQTKNISIQIVKDDSLKHAYINGYREFFDKIMVNLLSNALKFTRTEILIEIRQEGAWCLVSVTDNGPGIPQEKQASVFIPFYQLKENMPKDNIGTGIGLSIVKKMTDKINWDIQIDSEPGKGSRFTLKMPVVEEVASETGYSEPQEADILEEEKGNETEHQPVIAVAEDNKDMCHFIVSLLKGEYEVHPYYDGNSLLEHLHDIHPDMIVSDIMMPGIDGIELCKTVKGNLPTSHIPIILLTAKSADTDEIDGLSVGADDYIRKPFSPDVLKARIRNLFENRKRLLQSFRSTPETRLEEILTNKEDQDFINKVNRIIEENLTNPELSVPFVLSRLCVSRSLFFLKMKNISGLTFTDYVRIARLKRAVKLMKQGEINFNEIAYQTGFSTPSYFFKCFKKQFGTTPSEYLRKIRSEA